MGSERVVGVRASDEPTQVSGIVPQSLVELFRLLAARAEVGSGQEDEAETWSVRVGYLQVWWMYTCHSSTGACKERAEDLEYVLLWSFCGF